LVSARRMRESPVYAVLTPAGDARERSKLGRAWRRARPEEGVRGQAIRTARRHVVRGRRSSAETGVSLLAQADPADTFRDWCPFLREERAYTSASSTRHSRRKHRKQVSSLPLEAAPSRPVLAPRFVSEAVLHLLHRLRTGRKDRRAGNASRSLILAVALWHAPVLAAPALVVLEREAETRLVKPAGHHLFAFRRQRV